MKKINLMFKERGFYNIFLPLVLLVFVIAIVPRIFASLQPIKSVEIYSEQLNYKNSEPGSWKITKSAKWINQKEAEITIDVDSILKVEEKYTDMIFVLDTSGSMEGERLDMLKSTTTSLADKLLDGENNRVALITFDQGSSIVSEFTNEKDTFIDKVNSLTAQWVTNYYQALVNVDRLMKNYVKEDNRECVVVFLTDGYPNYDTPNEVGEYSYLKKTYPYLLINAIQYEMGDEVTEEVKRISDNQYVASVDNLESILNEATVVPMVYESFDIEDFIDTNYFYIESKNDVKADFGSVTFDKDKQKINWSLDGLRTGKSSTLTVKVRVKDEVREDIFPVNESIGVVSSLGDVREDINSKLTPVLKEKYEVVYDVNVPSECRGLKNPDVEKHSVFETVGVSEEEPKCEGYQFKGWKIISKNISKINDDYFIMPESDVKINGTWSKLDINKSMNGTVKESLTLYKQVQEDFNDPNKYVRKYTGDTSTFKGNEDVYYYYGAASNNNVVFANYCWKIVRTTDTGGVKLLYNGVPSGDGSCDNIGDDAVLTGEQMNRPNNTVPFNTTGGTPAATSYMFNSDAMYIWETKRDLISSQQIIIDVSMQMNENYSYYYSDNYHYRDDKLYYELDNPTKYSWEENYENLVGKYTCRNVSSAGICNNLSYVVKTDEKKLYYIELKNGSKIGDSGYELTIALSGTVKNNGDGTYSLSEPIVIDKTSWASDYQKYVGYYTCGNGDINCTEMKYVFSSNAREFRSLLYDNKYKYGNSFVWNGTNYVLENTIDVWNPFEKGILNNNHYTCFNTSGVCDNGKIFYIFSSLQNEIRYIELENGKGVNDALDEMLYNESANSESSTVKKAIEYWYENYMTDFTNYLEDTVWCSDRSMANALTNGWNPNGGDPLASLIFGYKVKANNLSCTNKNDRFTVDSSNGNGVLNYPVGLLTEQERQLAYDTKASPNSFLGLVDGDNWYWIMTPQDFRGMAHSMRVTADGNVGEIGSNSSVYLSFRVGARPAISLKSGMEYISGDGSVNRPYIIFTD